MSKYKHVLWALLALQGTVFAAGYGIRGERIISGTIPEGRIATYIDSIKDTSLEKDYVQVGESVTKIHIAAGSIGDASLAKDYVQNGELASIPDASMEADYLQVGELATIPDASMEADYLQVGELATIPDASLEATIDRTAFTASGNVIAGGLRLTGVDVPVTGDNQTITQTIGLVYLEPDAATASTRTILLTNGVAGNVLILSVSGTGNACEIADDGACSGGGNVRLSGTLTLDQYDNLILIHDGTDWKQLGAEGDN